MRETKATPETEEFIADKINSVLQKILLLLPDEDQGPIRADIEQALSDTSSEVFEPTTSNEYHTNSLDNNTALHCVLNSLKPSNQNIDDIDDDDDDDDDDIVCILLRALIHKFPNMLNEPNSHGDTPLHTAAESESLKILYAIKEAATKFNIRTNWHRQNNAEKSALDILVEQKDILFTPNTLHEHLRKLVGSASIGSNKKRKFRDSTIFGSAIFSYEKRRKTEEKDAKGPPITASSSPATTA